MIRNAAERQNYVLSLFMVLAYSIVFSTSSSLFIGRYFIKVFVSVIEMKYFHK